MQLIVADSPQTMGQWTAYRAAELLKTAVAASGQARMIVATGASQFEVLKHLVARDDVPWEAITGFHLDEYVGLDESHPASFCRYLRERLVSRVPLKAFHFLPGDQDPAQTIARVGAELQSAPVDVALVGIGENAHLAFNDPPADFDSDDPYLIVSLDEACRRQQVGEGWFETLADVPTDAISMSIQQILKTRHILCSVPDQRKSAAVHKTVEGAVDPNVPASILQSHPDTALVLDTAAASQLSAATRRAAECVG